MQKSIDLIPIPPPPAEQRVRRDARFAAPGEHRNRYHLPDALESASPVGYRMRVSLTVDEAAQAAVLLSLEPPVAFVPSPPVTEGELFDETSLGILSARQSTNYRGHRQVIVGPDDSAGVAAALRALGALDQPVLDGATHSIIGLSRPYRTPFTFLLTFIGHKPIISLFTVATRAWSKRFDHVDDIPTIGYLQHLHVGVWADAVERAAVIASAGTRQANIILRPFSGRHYGENAAAMAPLEALAGLSSEERRAGWRVCFVAQVGAVAPRVGISAEVCRKVGANLVAFRSERIQPGVNAEEKAPPAYQTRQDMDVPDVLTEMAGRAAYNAFCRWSGVDRDDAKALLLLDRIDVLTPNGKERLRAVRKHLEEVTDSLCADLPLWADLPTGRKLSNNAARGKKAFALTGQRIYVGGLSRPEIEARGIDFSHAARALGAAASRSALVCELGGCIDLPETCDLLAGICLMAGPVNQNDIGKQFYGAADLLAETYAGRNPTSILVWTLKAKTVADPIGNEEQLQSTSRKGALVDLRAGPHEVCAVRVDGALHAMRQLAGRTNHERAFADVDNFACDPHGREIPGNRGSRWPADVRERAPWARVERASE